MLFLDALYREASAKAGITYVDVWDGFVDEAGRFLQKGPDFEGQIRQLRTYDGVFFTKAGARKLAHYVEREVTRLLAARSGPIALPTEPATPDANAVPGQPAPRPLAGPILPLVASSVGTDQLLGGPGSRPASVDALAARTLVKGEPLAPPAGRAMISPGHAAKSAASRPRVKRRSRPRHRMPQRRALLPPRRQSRAAEEDVRPARRPKPRPTRRGISSVVLAMRRGSRWHHRHGLRDLSRRVRRPMSAIGGRARQLYEMVVVNLVVPRRSVRIAPGTTLHASRIPDSSRVRNHERVADA
jgi:hypothetical protein